MAVNYIYEINAFHNWMSAMRLSSGQQALWFHLMDINNRTGWKETFTVANLTLCDRTSLSRQGLDKARQSLVDYGRIEYRPGIGSQAGTYKMIYFDRQIVGTTVVTEVGTNISWADSRHNSSHEVGTTVAHYLKEDSKQETNNNSSSKAPRLYQQEIGVPSSMIVDMLLDDIKTYTDEWVCDAIREAVKNNVRKYAYVRKILETWGTTGRGSSNVAKSGKAAKRIDLEESRAQRERELDLFRQEFGELPS